MHLLSPVKGKVAFLSHGMCDGGLCKAWNALKGGPVTTPAVSFDPRLGSWSCSACVCDALGDPNTFHIAAHQRTPAPGV